MYNIGPIFPIILLVFLLLFFCLIADKINTFKNYTALALMQLCLLSVCATGLPQYPAHNTI